MNESATRRRGLSQEELRDEILDGITTPTNMAAQAPRLVIDAGAAPMTADLMHNAMSSCWIEGVYPVQARARWDRATTTLLATDFGSIRLVNDLEAEPGKVYLVGSVATKAAKGGSECVVLASIFNVMDHKGLISRTHIEDREVECAGDQARRPVELALADAEERVRELEEELTKLQEAFADAEASMAQRADKRQLVIEDTKEILEQMRFSDGDEIQEMEMHITRSYLLSVLDVAGENDA